MITFVIGNLLDSTEKYIVHQANCVSHYAAGIADAIFSKYPHANIYTPRMKPDVPGTIIIKGNGTTERYVVNLLGQYQPGSFDNESSSDTEDDRKKYFHHALIRLAKIPDLESVALPAGIGCGIAGGNWEWYLGTIKNFSDYVEKTQNAKVFIYCLPELQTKYVPK